MTAFAPMTAFDCEKIDDFYWRYTTHERDELFIHKMVQPAVEHFARQGLSCAFVLDKQDGALVVRAIALKKIGADAPQAVSLSAQQELSDGVQLTELKESQWSPKQLSFD